MNHRISFTKRNLDQIPFTTKGQVSYWDITNPGFGLVVGIRTKTFVVQVDVKDPSRPTGYRTVRHTLGRYGEITLEEARKQLLGRQEEVHGKVVFIPGKRLELKTNVFLVGSDITLHDMLLAYYTEKRTKTGHDYKRSTVDGANAIILRLFPTWLPLTLPEIANLKPDTIINRYKQVENSSGAFAARNAFTILKSIVGYATVKYPAVFDRNPFAVLTMPGMNIMKRINARSECLQGGDFQQFYQRIQSFHPAIFDCLLICLYHGLRRAEAEGLRWQYVNLEKREMRIPDTKNRQALHVPLSQQTWEILNRRKELADGWNPYVFPTVRDDIGKTGHVQLSPATLRDRTGLEITVHALRRTFITIGRRLKLHADTDKLTNHIDSTVAGKYYDATGVDDLREALQMIDNEIERMMLEGVGAKVVPLPSRRNT
ncbi:integrase [Geomonas limicola]|uniref:Integrase n=1 Tax=Geomonas limicola TaxID=2740186 RepID=A0A6V8N7K0_9BACT|nr:tyrosine-type recombinase/integrase [Geomonas limicola]GFO68471.1 integrase [Geomonas limicola]